MPAVSDASLLLTTTPTYQILAASSSAAPRQKLKTPLITGSVCGGVVGLAWIIGFTIYFHKRYRRRKLKRKIESGKAIQKQKPPKIPEENVVVPPDPAVLLGHHAPGDRVFGNEGNGHQGRLSTGADNQPKAAERHNERATSYLAEEMTVPPNA